MLKKKKKKDLTGFSHTNIQQVDDFYILFLLYGDIKLKVNNV